MQKRCYDCGQLKPVEEFNKNKVKRDGRNSQCRECYLKYAKRYYKANKKECVLRAKEGNRARRLKTLKWISDYLDTHCCVDCGEANPVVLEFDHVRGKKKIQVKYAAHAAYSLKAIEEEISKCEVRCANCHKLRHFKERQSKRIGRMDRHLSLKQA